MFQYALARRLSVERKTSLFAAQLGADCVSVHVRRGDYVEVEEFNWFFGACSPEWYGAAIERILDRVKKPRFFVFSDDPQWARTNLPLQTYNTQFHHRQPDGRDFEDLVLMSMCSHPIVDVLPSYYRK